MERLFYDGAGGEGERLSHHTPRWKILRVILVDVYPFSLNAQRSTDLTGR
jgi:hypothetical protein